MQLRHRKIFCSGRLRWKTIILSYLLLRGRRGGYTAGSATVEAAMLQRLRRRQLLRLAAVGAGGVAATACGGDAMTVSPDPDLPPGPFGASSTAESVTAGLDLSGRTALVTGCNSGLGFETMRVLALRGCHVIGTGRTLAKARVACDSVDGVTTPVALELTDFDSVVACAAAVAARFRNLDMLVLNAGINTFGELELVGGIEKIFVVNFLGHFLLTRELLPLMLGNAGGRIVHVSSRSAWKQAPAAGIDFDNLRGEGAFDAGEAYGRSKLANALFSLELARRLEGSGVTSNALHPGLVKTNIARSAPTPLRTAFDLLGGFIARTPAEGAATQVYLAAHPSVEGVNGRFFVDCNPVVVSGSHHLTDAGMADRLWRTAEDMTAGFGRGMTNA
jgi:NAD(P)-dependent dehydrogenase (short-subunit alcohol dehydrogenase family)